MQARLQQKAKPKTQLVCVCWMVHVVFGICVHSNKHCTCGQASACHVNGARDAPVVPKQYNDMTNKMNNALLAWEEQKRRQEKCAKDVEEVCWD